MLRGWSFGRGDYFRVRDHIGRSRGGNHTRDGFGGRQDFAGVRFALQVLDLRFDLRLELVAGAAEFVEGAPDLAANLRHLLGPKQEEGEQEDKNHFREAEIHICHDTAGDSWRQSRVLEQSGVTSITTRQCERLKNISLAMLYFEQLTRSGEAR